MTKKRAGTAQSAAGSGNSRRRPIRPTMNALRDETYRSMLRWEAGKTGAASSLCAALLTSWTAAASVENPEQFEEWLRKITPICLAMIAGSAELGSSSNAPRLHDTNDTSTQQELRTIMEVKVVHLGRVRFSIQSREHTIISDQPAENDGQDTGMTPPELLLASLGSCAAFYAAQYLKTRSLADTGVEVSVTAEKLKQPARMGGFRIHVNSPVELTEDQRLGLLRSVHQCLVHNTLMSQPEIAIDLTTPEKTAVQ